MPGPFSVVGGASADLGLTDQLATETEEERKKRLLAEAQRKAMGPAATPFGGAAKTLGLGAFGSMAGGRGY